jgi:integrase
MMLFKTYSRYVPNLTRRDGSAFDRLVTGAMVPANAAEMTTVSRNGGVSDAA